MADKEPPLNSKSDSSPGSGSTTDEEGKTSENSPSSKEPSPIGDSQAASKGKPSGRRKKWFQRVFPSEAVRVGIYLSFSAACIFICLWQAWLGLTSLPEIPSVVLVAPYFLVAFACALFSFWLPLSHLSYTGLYDVRLLMVPTELYEQLKKGSVDDGALRFFHGKHRFPRFPALILTLVVFAQWLIVLLCFFVVFGILYATDELTNHTIEWLQTIANIETIFQSQFPLALSVSVFIITTLTAFATILKVRWHRGRLMVVGRDISFLLWRFQCGKKIQAQDCVLPAQNKEFSEVIHQHELWVESGGYQGERAHFSSAKLPGYDFGDLNLSSARFSMCDLTASNFSGTHLQNAEFDNNDLSYANFRHTNLSHASMSGSSNLRTLRLGGANLSGATLPPSISFDETLKGVEENTKSASDIFKLMLAACLISWVTLSTSPDWRLIDSSGRSALPLINTEVPLAGFYVVAPIILFGFYIYFHLYLQSLIEKLATLPAIFPDATTLNDKVFPWLLSSLVEFRFPQLRWDRNSLSTVNLIVSVSCAWFLVPATIAACWIRYLPAESIIGTMIQIITLGSASIFGLVTLNLAINTLGPDLYTPVHKEYWTDQFRTDVLDGLSVSAVLALISWLVFWGPAVPVDQLYPQLTGAQLSRYPDEKSRDLDSVIAGKLVGKNLHLARMESCFMPKTDLSKSVLTDAKLNWADAREADFSQADLSGADLTYAHLDRANMCCGNFSRCNFSLADLKESKCGSRLGVQMLSIAESKALKEKLQEQWQMGMSFSVRQLFRNTLSGPKKTPWHADCKFNGSNLNGADFKGCNLPTVSFEGAKMFGTSFAESDLRFACFNHAFNSRGGVLEHLKKGLAARLKEMLPDLNYSVITTGATDFSPNCKLDGAEFDDSRLYNANFAGAQAGFATFRSAQLVDCVFDDANLTRAQFTYSTVDGSSFRDAILDGANFDFSNVTAEQIAQAKSFNYVTLPEAVMKELRENSSVFGEDQPEIPARVESLILPDVAHQAGSNIYLHDTLFKATIDSGYTQADGHGKPFLVYMRDPNSQRCEAFENRVLTDPRVKSLLSEYIVCSVVYPNSDDAKLLKNDFGCQAFPHFLLFDRAGKLQGRWYENFESPDLFITQVSSLAPELPNLNPIENRRTDTARHNFEDQKTR